MLYKKSWLEGREAPTEDCPLSSEGLNQKPRKKIAPLPCVVFAGAVLSVIVPKDQILELILNQPQTISDRAELIGLNPHTLAYWCQQAHLRASDIAHLIHQPTDATIDYLEERVLITLKNGLKCDLVNLPKNRTDEPNLFKLEAFTEA